MAPKRKSSPAPPADAKSSSSDDDSSSDAEQYVTQRNPPRAETPEPTERDDDESDSGTESDSEPEPPTKTLKTPQKPSESEDSSEEDEEEEQKEVEKIKSPVKNINTHQKPSESEDSSEEDEEEEEEEKEQVEKPKSPMKVPEPEPEPDQKKQKLSSPDQSSSKKLSVAVRIWSLEDEMTVLNALCEYQVRNNKLPPTKDYASFLSGICGSISFPVTEKQLFNKIRQLRFNYNQKKKKGSNINFSESREKSVFELCTKLFEDGSSASKNGSPYEMNRAGKKSDGKRKKNITKLGSLTVANGGTATIDNGVANVGAVNGAEANGGDLSRSHFYLEGLIKDMISIKRCPRGVSSVEDVVARIGESKANELESKTKMLKIDSIKLHAREGKLMAELLDVLADEMMDD